MPKKQLGTAEAVRSYKRLCEVERALRSLTTVQSVRTLLQDLTTVVRNTCITCGAQTPSAGLQLVPPPTSNTAPCNCSSKLPLATYLTPDYPQAT